MALFFRRVRDHFVAPRRPAVAPPPPRAPYVASRPSIGYILVVDESGSTAQPLRVAGNRTVTRMSAIQSATCGYLHHLRAVSPWQQVAIIGFSEFARLYHPLSPVGHNLHGLFQAVGALHPQGTTNLSAGIEMALGQLAAARIALGNIVVITDGAANVARERLEGLVARARATRVRIFTIGVGNNTDADYERDLLLRMAQATRGRFSSAHSFDALCQALRGAA